MGQPKTMDMGKMVKHTWTKHPLGIFTGLALRSRERQMGLHTISNGCKRDLDDISTGNGDIQAAKIIIRNANI